LIPIPRVNPSGVIVIDTIVGAVTVTVVDCEIPAKVAEMLVEPTAAAVSSPLASMVAAAVEEELHATRAVMSEVLPSL
jgi:hypothetical protein